MKVAIAYVLVVLIWATTPLAIVLSSESLSFISAVTVRMSLAFVVVCGILLARGQALSLADGNWKIYLVASLGLFPNMPLIYWSAQFIPSGLLAIIFGLAPFFTGLYAWVFLKENVFSLRRVVALLLALGGLVLIFKDQLQLGGDAIYGVLGALGSCVLFATTSTLLKQMNSGLGAMNQTTGAIAFSLPGFLLMWYWLDGQIPTEVSSDSLMAIVYLAILGSVLGISLFMFLIRHLSMDSVALTTMISPVLALMIGAGFAGEVLTPTLISGAVLVLLALLLYQGIGLQFIKRRLSHSPVLEEELDRAY